jgi:hypothetical protein
MSITSRARARFVASVAALLPCVAASACDQDGNALALADGGGDDAPADALADGAIPCTSTGISKGPWSLHADSTSILVRWEACMPGTPAGLSYAPESGGAPIHAQAVETPFVVTTTNMVPLNQLPDYAGTWYMHEASLTGLQPSTCYHYGLDADPTISARFCTARASGDHLRFLAIGDTNASLGPNTANVLAHTVPKQPDLTLHGGDIEYYASFVETWASWFPVMAPLLRAAPLYTAVGNHDVGSVSGEPDLKYMQYTERFFGGAGFDSTDAYYRFESGGVWFFALDTQQALDLSSAQGAWLVKELGDAAGRPGYRFSVVYMHKPFLTCGDTGDDTQDLAMLEPYFDMYKVPLVVQAHMHGYERFETPKRTFVTAAGGGGLIGNPNANTSRSYCNERVASGGFFSATVFDVTTGQLAGTTIDDQGVVRDSFTRAVP